MLTALYGGHQLKYAIDCIESIGRKLNILNNFKSSGCCELMNVRVSKVSVNGSESEQLKTTQTNTISLQNTSISLDILFLNSSLESYRE